MFEFGFVVIVIFVIFYSFILFVRVIVCDKRNGSVVDVCMFVLMMRRIKV